MTRSIATTRLPWEDRWNQPSVDLLLKPLNAQRKRQVSMVLEELAGWDDLEQKVIWYGPGWNWTIQFQLKAKHDLESDILCYIVPKVDGPMVCVPLSDREIERLPIKRLNKLIRNGIRVAKCAVAIHWAVWSPANQTEVGHVIDLLRRKRKAAVAASAEPVAAAKSNGKTAAKPSRTSKK